MTKTLKNVLLHTLALAVFLSFDFTFAANGQIDNPLNTTSLVDFFAKVVSVLIEMGTIVSVLAIMYGGFLYATAGGDEEKLGKAYKTVTWALVGTAVLLGARTIMVAVSGTIAGLN